jgi:hypothetical protein
MRKLFAALSLAILLVIGAGSALAASNPNGQGQFSQTCLSATAPNEPGQAANAPGSAFNETGPGTASTVYAGKASRRRPREARTPSRSTTWPAIR